MAPYEVKVIRLTADDVRRLLEIAAEEKAKEFSPEYQAIGFAVRPTGYRLEHDVVVTLEKVVNK